MTRNIPKLTDSQIKHLLEEKQKLKMEKEALVALCVSLLLILGSVLVLF
jgi:hypothetical protein